MLCGFRALADYAGKEQHVKNISALLSAKEDKISQAAEHLKDECGRLKAKLLEEQKKELEADLEQAIQKGRRCGISDEDIKSLFELILEG